MSIVIDNLREALQGESNAKRKYELFAEHAEKEGLSEIARLFKAVSMAETIHIKNHLQALSVITNSDVQIEDIVKINEEDIKRKIKSTQMNLIDAYEGEIYETKKMYKNFEKNSKKEDSAVAELTFSLARKAEKVHADLFQNYYKLLKKGKSIEKVDLYVCQICGNVEINEAPEICPICDHSQQFFKKI